MKNKKSNNINESKIKYVVIAAIAILLILGLIVIINLVLKNRNKIKEENEISYICQKLADETDIYTNYSIIKINTNKNIIENSTIETKLQVKNPDIFNDLINNAEFMENKNSDANNLVINYNPEENIVSYIEEKVNYSDYKNVLENEGYTCEVEKNS